MPQINKVAGKIGLGTKLAVKKISSQLNKRGLENIYTGISKNGTIGIIGQSVDGFYKEAHIINPDGQRFLKTYHRIDSTGEGKGFFNRIITKWNITKKRPTFVERSTLYYEGHKLPTLISTIPKEEGCDGIEIVNRFPFKVYAKNYMKQN